MEDEVDKKDRTIHKWETDIKSKILEKAKKYN